MQTSSRPSFITALGSTRIPPPVHRPLPTSTSIASASIRSSSILITNAAGANRERVLSNAATYVPVAPKLDRHPVRGLVHLGVEARPGDVDEAPAHGAGGDLDHVEVRGLRIGEQRDRGIELPRADPLGEVVTRAGRQRGQGRAGARAEDAVRRERHRAVAAEGCHDPRAALGGLASEPLHVGTGLRDADLVRHAQPVQSPT